MTRGFTLIECLVFLALIAMLLSGAYAIASSSALVTDSADATARLIAEERLVYELIRDEAYAGTGIETAAEDVLRFADGMGQIIRTDSTLQYHIGDRKFPIISPEVSVEAFGTSYEAGSSELEVFLTLSATTSNGSILTRSVRYHFSL